MWIIESSFKDTIIDILTKIIKIFFAVYMVGLILFTYDGVIWSSTWIQDKAKFAIVYCNIKTDKSIISNKVKAKIDTAIWLFFEWKVEKIILHSPNEMYWKVQLVVMKNYALQKWVPLNALVLDSENNTITDVSNYAFNINKWNWNYPNVWVIWISGFYQLNSIRSSLKNTWFSYVWVENSSYYSFLDIFRVIGEYNGYLFDNIIILVHWTSDNKEVIWKVGTKVVEISAQWFRNKMKMINSMNIYYVREFKNNFSQTIEIINEHRAREKNFSNNVERYHLGKIKNTVDDSLLVLHRIWDDFMNISNAARSNYETKNIILEKKWSTNFVYILIRDLQKKIIWFKSFILTIIYMPFDFIVSIWNSIWDYIESNSQTY